MTQQTEALRLADALITPYMDVRRLAAAELRRLHAENERQTITNQWRAEEIDKLRAINAQLLEALEDLLQDTQHDDHICEDLKWCPVVKARAAIAAAKGEA